ncbi:MAG: hypothetical protein ACOX7P_03340 [Oscillospiraceae bacterium]
MAKQKSQKQRIIKIPDPMANRSDYKKYSRDIELNRYTASVGIFPLLFWWPLVKKPDSEYCRECANQGLILLLLGLVFAAATYVYSLLSQKMIGDYYHYELFGYCALALEIAFCINGLLTVQDGKHFRVPLAGRIRIIK